MELIDKFLNNMTMYRLVVYSLGILAALGVGFALIGKLPFEPTHMVVSLSLILTIAYMTDRGFGRLFNVPTNTESWLITGLILFLIVRPADSVATGLALGLAAAISSASKFLLAWRGRHIFNPAALAAAFLSIWGLLPATWWVGNSLFWPASLILGLAIVRKIRRFELLTAFVLVSVGLQCIQIMNQHQALLPNLKHALIASPLIFLSTIMLTEPATMPPRRKLQIIFAALVAVLYTQGWQVGPLNIYPEVALLIGNIFAYAVSSRFRVRLQLKEIQQISDRVYDYVFAPDFRFKFLPGQYMEWTLAGVPYDSRGNRRTFTIASSPTESEVHLGLKYYEPASTYKAKFYNLQPGDYIFGSQLAGNFTLNGNEGKKLAFIAGGIGITPFRSMVKYLIDNNLQSDIVLLYIVSDPQEFAYVKELREAAATGIRTIPVVTDLSYSAQGIVTTKLSEQALARLIPDYNERLFYVSGPNTMVDATKKYLHHLGVSKRKIKTDHFSGY